MKYTVQKGDTLWLIAKRFGLGLNELIAANPQIADPNQIKAGDILHIPVDKSSKKENKYNDADEKYKYKKYKKKIKKKSNKYDKKPDKYKEKEKEKHKDKQEETAVCDLGSLPQPEAETIFYVTKKGDTLLKIAEIFNVSLNELMAHNQHIEKKDKIRPGYKLKVPVSQKTFVALSPVTPILPNLLNTPTCYNTKTFIPLMDGSNYHHVPGMAPAIPMPQMMQGCPFKDSCLQMVQIMQAREMGQMFMIPMGMSWFHGE